MDECKGRQERATKRKERLKFQVATAHSGGLYFSIVHAIIWELNVPSPFTLLHDNVNTFEFIEISLCMQETFVCGGAISHVTVEVCLNSSCSTTNGTVTMLHDGVKRVIATFTDLTENRINYIATLNINYNGGVVQQSQPVENISECWFVALLYFHVLPCRYF